MRVGITAFKAEFAGVRLAELASGNGASNHSADVSALLERD
jgi:hypothetical protein